MKQSIDDYFKIKQNAVHAVLMVAGTKDVRMYMYVCVYQIGIRDNLEEWKNMSVSEPCPVQGAGRGRQSLSVCFWVVFLKCVLKVISRKFLRKDYVRFINLS